MRSRIHQTHCFLHALVQDLRSGSLLPASFQRPYVWTRDDCLALFNSILRGYPVGSFLLWTPSPETALKTVSRGRLGPIVGAANPRWSSLLLDGQNRLATMAWLGHDWDNDVYPADATEHEKSVWAADQRLVLDLVEEKLVFVDASQAEAGMKLPARVLVDTRASMAIMRPRWNRWEAEFGKDRADDGLRWMDKAQNAFRDARVTATLIEYASPSEARDAFLHICRTGVPMSEEDFNNAVNWLLVS